ncbi:MAG: cytochrome C [Sulfuricurvum sp.]|jgi:cytochrome c5|uniref:c-type cytochrome n=1 Tax=Sulfuricurvum sp. TaxID=2025608 RepID=UPI0025E7675D|nr:c-type cytochrome [Sulfuricurvum sp.]MCK9372401.1 cytochrome C [Sulfuricurvum sp.]
MRKFYLIAVVALISSSAVLSAATYKGQKVYIETCKECHGGGQEMAGSKKQRAWEKLMDKKGEGLADIHFASKKAQPSWEYFKSRNYTKDAKHLEDFLIEYGSDSGNVPACN